MLSLQQELVNLRSISPLVNIHEIAIHLWLLPMELTSIRVRELFAGEAIEVVLEETWYWNLNLHVPKQAALLRRTQPAIIKLKLKYIYN